MCLALHILKDARSTKAASEGSTTNRLVRHHHKPLALLETGSHYAANASCKTTVGPFQEEHLRTRPSKSCGNRTRAFILYLHIHTHIIKILFSHPEKWLFKRQHDQSFVRPSSLIPLLILGDVGLCGPTLTTRAAPRSAVAAVLMALTAT
jgi:hypothetical protein